MRISKLLPVLVALPLLAATASCDNPTKEAWLEDHAQHNEATSSLHDRAGASGATMTDNVGVDAGVRTTDQAATDEIPAADPAQPGEATTPDANFVNAVLADGAFELLISNMALKRSENPEIQQFAKQMIADHTKASTDLKAIAGAAGLNYSDRLTRDQLSNQGHLEKLYKDDFDRDYAKIVRDGHQAAVSRLENAPQELSRPELIAFATKTLPTIKMHYQMAQKLNVGPSDAM